jgi:hypothetical protein
MRFVLSPRRASRASLLAVLTLTLGCVREPTASLPSISDIIADVVLATDPSLHGVLNSGYPANAGTANGTLTLSAPVAVINGGSAQIQVSDATAFQTIVLFVAGRPGYYVLSLPAPVTSASLLVTLTTGLNSSISWVLGVGPNAAGAGNYTARSSSFVPVLSGDVQVSVAWDSPADVDLHVVEPGSEEIYYGNTQSAAGGVLDLDSNAACGTDGPRNENITYPNVTPPGGTYIVRVDNWDSCGATATNFVVTIRVAGHALQVLQGQFTDPGDQGGANSGLTLGSFTYP